MEPVQTDVPESPLMLKRFREADGQTYAMGTHSDKKGSVTAVFYMDKHARKQYVDWEKLILLGSLPVKDGVGVEIWSYRENALAFMVKVNVMGNLQQDKVFYVHEEKELKRKALYCFAQKHKLSVALLTHYVNNNNGYEAYPIKGA